MPQDLSSNSQPLPKWGYVLEVVVRKNSIARLQTRNSIRDGGLPELVWHRRRKIRHDDGVNGCFVSRGARAVVSLAMRSSPHVGFSLPIRRIRACTCFGIGGRPGRDFGRQNSLQPARCQRIIVSGRTTTRASCQSKNYDNTLNLIRVTESILRGRAPRSI